MSTPSQRDIVRRRGLAYTALTDQEANLAFDILVQHAGASEYWRRDFVHTLTKWDGSWPMEYRFGGSLGMGGKFRIGQTDGRLYVDQYREDETEKSRDAIHLTNKALEAVR